MTQAGGEKELILGNKQLISLFFVVVALCGVFFAMGYMVRGNTLKGSVAATDTSAAQGGDTIKRQQPEPPRETADAGSVPQSEDAPTVTHPAEDAGAAPPADNSSTEAKPPVTAEAKPETAESGATYVQVVALPRPEAESTVRTLLEQHLPAAIAASSKEGLFRVRVGPYHTTADVADAKAKLKTLGFSNTIVQKP
jgi:cell division septation protein DedD